MATPGPGAGQGLARGFTDKAVHGTETAQAPQPKQKLTTDDILEKALARALAPDATADDVLTSADAQQAASQRVQPRHSRPSWSPPLADAQVDAILASAATSAPAVSAPAPDLFDQLRAEMFEDHPAVAPPEIDRKLARRVFADVLADEAR